MPVLSPDGTPVPTRWVEDLFARLAAIPGGSMSNVYASADPDRVKAEWAEALAGFSAEEVKRGLAATRTRKFAPNLPEFLCTCAGLHSTPRSRGSSRAGHASHARASASRGRIPRCTGPGGSSASSCAAALRAMPQTLGRCTHRRVREGCMGDAADRRIAVSPRRAADVQPEMSAEALEKLRGCAEG